MKKKKKKKASRSTGDGRRKLRGMLEHGAHDVAPVGGAKVHHRGRTLPRAAARCCGRGLLALSVALVRSPQRRRALVEEALPAGSRRG